MHHKSEDCRVNKKAKIGNWGIFLKNENFMLKFWNIKENGSFATDLLHVIVQYLPVQWFENWEFCVHLIYCRSGQDSKLYSNKCLVIHVLLSLVLCCIDYGTQCCSYSTTVSTTVLYIQSYLHYCTLFDMHAQCTQKLIKLMFCQGTVIQCIYIIEWNCVHASTKYHNRKFCYFHLCKFVTLV